MSLLGLLRGGSAEPFEHRELIFHFPYYHPEKGFEAAPGAIGVADGFISQTRPVSAIRVGQKKLLYFWEDGRTELYDLDGDLAESIAGGVVHELAQASGRPVCFYCAYGERSAMAVEAAQQAGLRNACHLAGGIDAWRKGGGTLVDAARASR